MGIMDHQEADELRKLSLLEKEVTNLKVSLSIIATRMGIALDGATNGNGILHSIESIQKTIKEETQYQHKKVLDLKELILEKIDSNNALVFDKLEVNSKRFENRLENLNKSLTDRLENMSKELNNRIDRHKNEANRLASTEFPEFKSIVIQDLKDLQTSLRSLEANQASVVQSTLKKWGRNVVVLAGGLGVIGGLYLTWVKPSFDAKEERLKEENVRHFKELVLQVIEEKEYKAYKTQLYLEEEKENDNTNK